MAAAAHCSICQNDSVNGVDFEGLACGCVYHRTCLAILKEKEVSMKHMRCPNCRRDRQEVRKLEQALLIRGGPFILEDAELLPRSPARTEPGPEEEEEQNPLSGMEAQLDVSPLVDPPGQPVFCPVCASSVQLVGCATDGGVLNCLVCLNRAVNKVLKEWPTEDFKGWTVDDKKKFLTDIEQIKSMDELQEFVSYRLEHKYHQETEFLNNSGAVLLDSSGAFLPLSVRAAKGFDTDAMTRNARPGDIQIHPVYGMTYRSAFFPTPVSTPRFNIAEEQKVAREAEKKRWREAKEVVKAAREAEKSASVRRKRSRRLQERLKRSASLKHS